MNLHSRSLRVLGQGLVIVLSILLAFGIDAWWGERSLRLEVEQEVQNVHQELAANRERIRQSLGFLTRVSDATGDLIGRLDAQTDRSVITVPDTLAWLGQSIPFTTDLSFGALDALVSSGRLAFVVDPVARAGLSELRGRVADAGEGERRLIQLYDSYYLPLLSTSLDLSAVYAVADIFWLGDLRDPDRALQSRTGVAFPNTPAFRNYLRLRSIIVTSVANEWRTLLEAIDNLLGRLEAV